MTLNDFIQLQTISFISLKTIQFVNSIIKNSNKVLLYHAFVLINHLSFLLFQFLLQSVHKLCYLGYGKLNPVRNLVMKGLKCDATINITMFLLFWCFVSRS